jgi:hypothetical protein
MSAWLTVPAEMVGLLREGLHSEIEAAVHLIAPVVEAPGREEHPERYQAPLARLDAARALLDLVGWSTAGPPVDVRVDLRQHHRSLLRALRSELLVEEEALGGGQESGPRDSAERRPARPLRRGDSTGVGERSAATGARSAPVDSP